MKLKGLLLSLTAAAVIFTGCSSKPAEDKNPPVDNDSDVVTSASVATDADSLKKAMSADGTWIVVVQQDLAVEDELVLEGEVAKKEGAEYTGRKLALYDQDKDKNITASYKLTAPKLTIKSDKTTIKGGTIVGDLYVEAKNVTLDHATIEGNVYFANEEVKSSFTLTESKVTGTQEVSK